MQDSDNASYGSLRKELLVSKSPQQLMLIVAGFYLCVYFVNDKIAMQTLKHKVNDFRLSSSNPS